MRNNINCYFSTETYVLGAQKNSLDENRHKTVLLNTQNMFEQMNKKTNMVLYTVYLKDIKKLRMYSYIKVLCRKLKFVPLCPNITVVPTKNDSDEIFCLQLTKSDSDEIFCLQLFSK